MSESFCSLKPQAKWQVELRAQMGEKNSVFNINFNNAVDWVHLSIVIFAYFCTVLSLQPNEEKKRLEDLNTHYNYDDLHRESSYMLFAYNIINKLAV